MVKFCKRLSPHNRNLTHHSLKPRISWSGSEYETCILFPTLNFILGGLPYSTLQPLKGQLDLTLSSHRSSEFRVEISLHTRSILETPTAPIEALSVAALFKPLVH